MNHLKLTCFKGEVGLYSSASMTTLDNVLLIQIYIGLSSLWLSPLCDNVSQDEIYWHLFDGRRYSEILRDTVVYLCRTVYLNRLFNWCLCKLIIFTSHALLYRRLTSDDVVALLYTVDVHCICGWCVCVAQWELHSTDGILYCTRPP